jgi:hypothetical protein
VEVCSNDKPGRADTASAGAVKPRKLASDKNKAPVGATQRETRALCRPYRGFTNSIHTIPGPHGPGKGYTDPSGRRQHVRTNS